MLTGKLKQWWPLIAAGAVLVLLAIAGVVTDSSHKNVDFTPQTLLSNAQCNVGVVSIDGFLDTARAQNQVDSLSIAWGIRNLASTGKNKALLILVDSRGGTPSAAEEISSAIKDTAIPNATFVRGSAVSGAYWIASNTDYIVAQKTAAVGSIGVTTSYLDEVKMNVIKGYTYQEIVSGQYKDTGSPDKPITSADKKYLQDYTNALFKLFIEEVKKNRNLTDSQIAKISDAKFYLANEAKDLGLIDAVGNLDDVKAYLAGKLNMKPEELVFCAPIVFNQTQSSNSAQ
jgi:signal peptide peptidase SppA